MLNRTAPLGSFGPPDAPNADGVGAKASLHWQGAGLLLAYLLLTWFWRARSGFTVDYDMWQFLPAPALEHELARSLLNLHSQPPLLNLLLGLALKSSRSTGIAPEALLGGLQVIVGGLAVLFIWGLATACLARPGWRYAVMALVLLNPYLYESLASFFYTPWEVLFLSAAGLGFFRYCRRPTMGTLAWTLGAALLLVYTHALFHPLWFFPLALFMVVYARVRRPGHWRSFTTLAFLSLLISLAWPAKNLVRFGFFGFSSWQGHGLTRGLPLQSALGRALFERGASDFTPPQIVAWAESRVPPEFRNEPALSELSKPDGSPNWNHFSVIPFAREAGQAAYGLLQKEPVWFLRKAVLFYDCCFTSYEGREPYAGRWFSELLSGWWGRAYETLVFQRFGAPPATGTPRFWSPYYGAPPPPETLFAFTFPVLLGLCIVMCFRRRAGEQTYSIAFMMYCILWVAALSLLVDGFESNRYRYTTEPFFFLAAGWAASELVDWYRQRRRSTSLDSP